MRESCKGCFHYRALGTTGAGLKACHYLLDMGVPRKTDPSECHSNGKYADISSKEGERRRKISQLLNEKFEFGKAIYGDTTYEERLNMKWILT